MKKQVVNCTTGEIDVIEMTQEEIEVILSETQEPKEAVPTIEDRILALEQREYK